MENEATQKINFFTGEGIEFKPETLRAMDKRFNATKERLERFPWVSDIALGVCIGLYSIRNEVPGSAALAIAEYLNNDEFRLEVNAVANSVFDVIPETASERNDKLGEKMVLSAVAGIKCDEAGP